MRGTYVKIRNAITLSALVYMLDNLKRFFLIRLSPCFVAAASFLLDCISL